MLENVMFQRKFSANFYKKLHLPLAQMQFGSLPLTTDRGDIYPRVYASGSFSETCLNGQYVFESQNGNAVVSRLMGRFNPYSTYELTVGEMCPGAKAGFSVSWADRMILVYAVLSGEDAEFFFEMDGKARFLGKTAYEKGMKLMFTFHAGVYIEAYAAVGENIYHVGDAKVQELSCLKEEKVFNGAEAAVYAQADGKIVLLGAENYLDSGIMQADIKPVKYENGEVLIENGKMYFTYTSRFEEEMMQQVASYRLSTCEFRTEGALLFDAGDGQWCGDVASTLIYDRMSGMWRIWMCVFSHGHVLAYGETEQDLRFGINVVDVKPLAPVPEDTDFGGREGDEDPDLYFDRETEKWYLAVCRKDPAVEKYRYYLFSSERPDKGFRFVSRSDDSIETTGGSFVRFGKEIRFVFGRSFTEKSRYDVCAFPSLEKVGEIKCNHPDGGFRGWGSVMEIPCGTRKRLLWATFDRTRGSGYNWSYGNLYFYESDTMKY